MKGLSKADPFGPEAAQKSPSEPALLRKLRDSLGQVAACKRLLKADGVAVIVADALGPIPARKQKRDAPLPQHVREREAQSTGKVNVENRKVEGPIARQRQRLIEAGSDRRDLVAEVGQEILDIHRDHDLIVDHERASHLR